MKKLRL